MCPNLYRDGLTIESIVAQHAEAAAHLWLIRNRATDEPHYAPRHLARLEERIEAHVDGLRVAGEAGWEVGWAQLDRYRGAGEMFAAMMLALGGGNADRIDKLVGFAADVPETLPGCLGAIGWCEPRLLGRAMRRWRASSDPLERFLGLVPYSLHRADPGPFLTMMLQDPDERVRARACRLAGEIGRNDLMISVARAMDDGAAEPAFWAAWSALLLGERSLAPRALEAVAGAPGPNQWVALEAVLRGGSLDRASRWVRGLNADTTQLRLVTVGLGYIGDPAAVPWLIDRMKDRKFARVAGESFATITGADLVDQDLERRRPEIPLDGPNDDPADDNVDLEPDENLPWPDPASVLSWWREHGPQFPRRIRHLLGRLITSDELEMIWAGGHQRYRRAAAYELALLRPGAPLANWRMRSLTCRP
jgi:uncharacterized protein (TIGR02270 family)